MDTSSWISGDQSKVLKQILAEARRIVAPSENEKAKLRTVTNKVLDLVRNAASKEGLDLTVQLGGSYAKDTWLPGANDIDVFLKFPPKVDRKRFEQLSIKIGLKSMRQYKPSLRYSEHPYVEAHVDGVRVNVVACYDVSRGEWISAADRSPYHTSFVVTSFTDKLKSEARLLKRFARTIGVYGAEIAVEGVSGYVCEVLVLKYGTFLGVLKALSLLKIGEVISISEAKQDLRNIFHSPLVILDPVDSRRNLGTAISAEKLGRMSLAASAFLRNPDVSYFKEPHGKSKLSHTDPAMLENIVVVVFRHNRRSEDILWGQLKRSLNSLRRQIELRGYSVLRGRCTSNNSNTSAFIFLLQGASLSNIQKKGGPSVFRHRDAAAFISKNYGSGKMLWVDEKANVHALQMRSYTLATENLEDILKKGASSGLAPGLMDEISSTFKIHCGKEILPIAHQLPWLEEAMSQIVTTDIFAFGSA